MPDWSERMAYLDPDTSFTISWCAWCGGSHEDVVCPRMLVTSGSGNVMAYTSVLSEDTTPARSYLWQEDNPLGVSRPAVLSNENYPTVLRVSQPDGWGLDVGLSYLERDRVNIEAVRDDEAPLSLISGVPQSTIASPQLLESAYSLVDGRDVTLIGDALLQVCKTCGSSHILAGSCPFEVTSLYGTHRAEVLNGSTLEDKPTLKSERSMVALPLEDLGFVGMIDQTPIDPSAVMVQDGAILPHQMWERVPYEGGGSAILSDVHTLACVNCGSYDHVGLSCSSSLALSASDQLQHGDLLGDDWRSVEQALFSEGLTPSWETLATVPAYVDVELVDCVEARVSDAVCDIVARYTLVEGDLIVQVVVVQANTGAISQIGRISTN